MSDMISINGAYFCRMEQNDDSTKLHKERTLCKNEPMMIHKLHRSDPFVE